MRPQERLLVRDVADYIEREIAPLKYGLLGDKNGLEFGSPDNEVAGIVVSWSPTSKVIEKSTAFRANLIISHEWTFYEHTGSKWLENEKWTFAKQANLRRLQLLSKKNINILKYHSNLDIAPGGTVDSFGEYLGFKNLIKKGRLIRVYREKPISLQRLASTVAKKLELERVEVCGDLNKRISYIGTAIGGLGQIFTYSDDFAESQAEVLIFGEMLEYTKIYTRESGYSYVATSHEASETPGMLKLTCLLRTRFPKANIRCVTSDGREISGKQPLQT
jgi:putative NIF3 family GTP cyclohydrolase 1 type 2